MRSNGTLVDELVEMGEPEAPLREAAEEYYDNRLLFGQFLVEHGLVSRDVVDIALARQARRRGRPGVVQEHFSSASRAIASRISEALRRFGDEARRFGDGSKGGTHVRRSNR